MKNKTNIISGVIYLVAVVLLSILASKSVNETISYNNEEYREALKIDNDANNFEKAIQGNEANAFIYGKISASEPVSMEGLDGEYLYIEKRTEKLEKSSSIEYDFLLKRYVSDTDTRWVTESIETKMCDTVTFYGRELDTSNVFKQGLNTYELCTIYEDDNTKHIYTVANSDCWGTVYTKVGNNNIVVNKIYNDKGAYESYSSVIENTDSTLFKLIVSLFILALPIYFIIRYFVNAYVTVYEYIKE